jgi:hypothetical protein
LSSRGGSYGTVAYSATITAIAIPLREAPAGRRAENSDEHDAATMTERRASESAAPR